MKDIQYVIVLNQTYSLSLVKGLALQTGADGICDPMLKCIEIEHSLTDERMRRVIMHELIHAYIYESGMGEWLEDQAEEMLCQSLSGFLNGILSWEFSHEAPACDE